MAATTTFDSCFILLSYFCVILVP